MHAYFDIINGRDDDDVNNNNNNNNHVICLKTRPQPLPKRVLHRVGSSAFSFNFKQLFKHSP